jgi:cytidylate kinase
MKYVITIGREYGSGGREIGEKLAKALNIPYYDKLIIDKMSESSSFSKEYLESVDENYTSQFMPYICNMYYLHNTYVDNNSVEQMINQARIDTIKKIAEEPCVIIGRAADYILSGQQNVVNVFISADEVDKINRVIQRNDDIKTERDALKRIHQINKNRKKYYEFVTSKNWGSAQSYDICLNSSLLGIDGVVEVLIQFLNTLENKK